MAATGNYSAVNDSNGGVLIFYQCLMIMREVTVMVIVT